MRLLTTLAIATILNLGLVSFSHAKPLAFLAKPASWAGTGCNAHSISETGSNTDTSKVLFDSYDAGQDSLSGLRRSACSFSVPIKVPRGFQISHLTVNWEGYVDGRGQLSRKYFLAGRPDTAWKRNSFNKPSGGHFKKRDFIYHSSFATGCNGGVYNLRINSQIKALSKKSYVALNAVNLPSAINLSLHLKPCR